MCQTGPALQSLSRQLCHDLGASGVLVTRVTERRQIILANSGFLLPRHLQHEMPLRYSICQHVVGMDYMLIVENAFTHPLLAYTSETKELGVGAYIGAPIHDASGTPFGAVCALQSKPRPWRPSEIDMVRHVAEAAERILNRQPLRQAGNRADTG